MAKKNLISWREFFLIIILFLIVAYLTQSNLDTVQSMIGQSGWGMFAYVVILSLAVIIAPVNATPLVPLAAYAWGWILAAVLSTIGWTLGSLIAFLIARRYGASLLQKIVSLERLEQYERLIPRENLFWSIVFLRMTIPVDLLSYVLGLFSTINTRRYLFATLIGIAPFAFAVAYVGRLPLFYQLLALSTGLLLLLFGIVVTLGRKKRND